MHADLVVEPTHSVPLKNSLLVFRCMCLYAHMHASIHRGWMVLNPLELGLQVVVSYSVCATLGPKL